MFKNYFRSSIRNINKNSVLFLINMLGLSVGLAASLILFFYVRFEFSFNTFHKNYDNIYRVLWTFSNSNQVRIEARSPSSMAAVFIDEIPEIVYGARTIPADIDEVVLNYVKHSFDNIIMADSSLFDLFNFPIVESINKRVLTHPNGVVLSQSAAKKMFGDKPCIGKQMMLFDSVPYTIEGGV